MELKRVKLKPNSPEFADDLDDTPEGPKIECEMPGCSAAAEHKAPKSRGADDYFQFCLQHVQEYNRAWNFFEGMAPQDVEDHMKANFYGHRPTWKSTSSPDMDEHLRHRAHDFRDFKTSGENREQKERDKKERADEKRHISAQTAETEAMAIMGLEPPLDLKKIKARYKELAKKYHPDLNRDDPDAEEQFKKVNVSYTILKLAFEKYQDRFAD
jgi:hypothetical protein